MEWNGRRREGVGVGVGRGEKMKKKAEKKTNTKNTHINKLETHLIKKLPPTPPHTVPRSVELNSLDRFSTIER